MRESVRRNLRIRHSAASTSGGWVRIEPGLRVTPDDAYLQIGVVTKPHGLRGELKVQLHWAESTALDHVDEVILADAQGTRRYPVVVARRTVGAVLLSLRDVNSREQAESLRGARVLVARAALPALEEGEYFLGDLLGAKVLGPDGAELGTVVAFSFYPTMDVLVVEAKDGTRKEQPLSDPWVGKVDAAAGCIELVSLDGMI